MVAVSVGDRRRSFRNSFRVCQAVSVPGVSGPGYEATSRPEWSIMYVLSH